MQGLEAEQRGGGREKPWSLTPLEKAGGFLPGSRLNRELGRPVRSLLEEAPLPTFTLAFPDKNIPDTKIIGVPMEGHIFSRPESESGVARIKNFIRWEIQEDVPFIRDAVVSAKDKTTVFARNAIERTGYGLLYLQQNPGIAIGKVDSAMKEAAARVGAGLEWTRRNPRKAARRAIQTLTPAAVAVSTAFCSPPASSRFNVEPIVVPPPAGESLPTSEPAEPQTFPTPSSEKSATYQTPTVMVAGGEITPSAQRSIATYTEALAKFLGEQFKQTKGKGRIPILNFVDARQSRDNPILYTVFSDEPGIKQVPTPENPSFIIDGNLYIVLRDKSGNGKIYPLSSPNVDYAFTYLNFTRSAMEYYDEEGYLVAHVPITPNSVGAMSLDRLPTSTPSPTATPSPTETPTITPSPTPKPIETLVPTEVPRMPELKIDGSRFMEGDKEIILKGAVTPYFLWNNYNRYPSQFKTEAKMLKDWGGNFIIIDWNAGLANDSFYKSSLLDAVKYANSIGLFVELSLHSNGFKDSKDPFSNIQMEVVDQKIIDAWAALLSDPTTAQEFGKYVGIFGILSESTYNADGSWLTLDTSVPVFDNACNKIRGLVGRKATCGYGTESYSGNLKPLLGKNFPRENVAWEVHPYEWTRSKGDFLSYVNQLRSQGYNVFVGEMLWKDSPAYSTELIKFLKDNGISAAAWGLAGGSSTTNLFIRDSRGNYTLTPNGELLKQFLGK